MTIDILDSESKVSSLEAQLAHTTEKIKIRDNVIEQLEEEIRTKERLIYEQGHLIQMLESDTKFDADSLNTESEITILEKHLVSSSPSRSDVNFDECERLSDRLEQIAIEREKLELQNEQLLRQWEDALEYVTKVQRQLQEEIKNNGDLKHQLLEIQCARKDGFFVTRNFSYKENADNEKDCGIYAQSERECIMETAKQIGIRAAGRVHLCAESTIRDWMKRYGQKVQQPQLTSLLSSNASTPISETSNDMEEENCRRGSSRRKNRFPKKYSAE